MEKRLNSEFVARYPYAAEMYQNSVELLETGMVAKSLLSARIALEAFVQYACREYELEIYTTGDEPLLKNRTDALHENGFISEQEATAMHRARLLGNKGAHAVGGSVDLTDAQEVINLLTTVFDAFPKRI